MTNCSLSYLPHPIITLRERFGGVIFGMLLLGAAQSVLAGKVDFAASKGSFCIADASSGATPLVVAEDEAEVVRLTAGLFASDVEQVAGSKPEILTTTLMNEPCLDWALVNLLVVRDIQRWQ